MKDELLIEARKALDNLWNTVPVKGRTWGKKNISSSMCGSHITLMNFHQCVTIWERDDKLRIKAYSKGQLFNRTMMYLRDAGLGSKIVIVD